MPALAFLLLNEALVMVVLTLNRVLLLYRYNPPEIWGFYRGDVLPAFARGLLFDLKTAAFLMAPLLLIALFEYYAKPTTILRLQKIVAAPLWFFTFLLLIIDQQYYSFFQSHINVLFFGVFDDDTKAVLTSAWTDHPAIRCLLILIVATAAVYWLMSRAQKYCAHLPKLGLKKYLPLYLFALGVHILAMRGSVGMLPLQRDDAVVSNHPFINYLVMNGLWAMKDALQDKSETVKFTPEAVILDKFQVKSVEEALKTLGKKSLADLYKVSAKKAAVFAKPPNIVYVMMESWGNFLFDYQSAGNNVLSTFEPHFKSDWVFRNFASSTDVTIYSLETLLMGKALSSVSFWDSPFRYSQFDTALAKPFKDKGYRTVFITSGQMGWRNSNQWIPKQYFDEVYGQNEIARVLPNVETCSWGVFDEFSFQLAQKILAEEKSKPVLIFIQTTSNHTPFELPSTFKPRPTLIPAELAPTLTTSSELARRSLVSFQYANKSLGDFLDFVKGDADRAAKTIVVATGDHNMWTLMPQNAQVIGARFKNSVPLYFYIPPYLKKGLYFDKNRPGSHKDIQTTLSELALSEGRYFNMGSDLFSRAPKETFFGVNESGSFHPLLYPGIDDKQGLKKKHAYFALNHIFFQRIFCTLNPPWCKK